MENNPQPFDVCIVCALPEEARAVLEMVQRHCENPLEERMSPRYGYSYRSAVLKNDKDELLMLHISWLPRYGPQEMTLHLSHVLEEYQPRISIMTGICAGDAEQVHLGDLVVAERTFTYDNGKFMLDDKGRRIHQYDTLTYQLDPNIMQFLGLFNGWEPLVASLKRPASSPEHRKRRKTTCHIKPMASGSAVRADHPFEEVRAPVRGTVAIDMEGAAFGLVMSRHPLIPWLVVKGICDYADRDKNDTYHDYAARASALFVLSFIQAYVTNERLPRSDRPSLSRRAGPPGVWNVPYRRNPYFTGRDDLLKRLHQQLTQQNDSTQTRRVALTQPQTIKGLGGIGKTQIAVEYAYRSHELGRNTHTFWINAANEETIVTSFVGIAALILPLFEKDEVDQRKLIAAIIRWLEKYEQRWLLIFDNADDLHILPEYLPKCGNGSILLTTRSDSDFPQAISIEVEDLSVMESTKLLLLRARRFDHAVHALEGDNATNMVIDEATHLVIDEATQLAIALHQFPLALDQAGAYINEIKCSFADYLQMYLEHREELLARRGLQATNYPNSVATTWSLSFQRVEEANPAAAQLLHLCAFLAPDRIPKELIKGGAAHWPPLLQQAAVDLYACNQMIGELLKFSLVKRLTDAETLSIHRVVQTVQIDMMQPKMQRQWAERVVRAINDVFPDKPQEIDTWPRCLLYLDQVQACHVLIEHFGFVFVEAASILNRAGLYLDGQALYSIVEPLYQRALAIFEQQLGATHPQTATSLNNLASLYLNQGKYEQAEQLYLRTLAIREEQLEANHPQTATTLNNLAVLYKLQGKYEQGEQLYQRALVITEQQLGTSHPDTVASLNNLAILYQSQGKYEQAEPLLERAVVINEQRLGATHPLTKQMINNYLLLLSKIHTDGDMEALLHLLAQAESDHDKDVGDSEETSS